jgi:hypothetical protein
MFTCLLWKRLLNVGNNSKNWKMGNGKRFMNGIINRMRYHNTNHVGVMHGFLL